MKYFDLGDLQKKDPLEPTDRMATEKFLRIHHEKIDNVKFLIRRLPEEDEIFFLWTMKSFNAFTFIPYLIKELGIIDELTLSTYSMNQRIADSLVNYIDKGKILKTSIYISDTMHVRRPRVIDHLNSLIAQRQDLLSLRFLWNHSKITLVEIQGQHFCIEGSGNWSENAQYEQYIFTRSRKIFDFRKSCITHGTEPGTN